MREVRIKTEYITLGQFLKFVGTIGSGSEAKLFLDNEDVYVNDEKEIRRGRKIYPNYIVRVLGEEYKVV